MVHLIFRRAQALVNAPKRHWRALLSNPKPPFALLLACKGLCIALGLPPARFLDDTGSSAREDHAQASLDHNASWASLASTAVIPPQFEPVRCIWRVLEVVLRYSTVWSHRSFPHTCAGLAQESGCHNCGKLHRLHPSPFLLLDQAVAQTSSSGALTSPVASSTSCSSPKASRRDSNHGLQSPHAVSGAGSRQPKALGATGVKGDRGAATASVPGRLRGKALAAVEAATALVARSAVIPTAGQHAGQHAGERGAPLTAPSSYDPALSDLLTRHSTWNVPPAAFLDEVRGLCSKGACMATLGDWLQQRFSSTPTTDCPREAGDETAEPVTRRRLSAVDSSVRSLAWLRSVELDPVRRAALRQVLHHKAIKDNRSHTPTTAPGQPQKPVTLGSSFHIATVTVDKESSGADHLLPLMIAWLRAFMTASRVGEAYWDMQPGRACDKELTRASRILFKVCMHSRTLVVL